MTMTEESFLFATQTLNANYRRGIGEEGVAFLIYNWGMTWKHYDNPVHRHSFYEICYVLEGEGEYEDDEVTHPLTGGTLFASLPGHWHQIRSRTGLRLFFVAFEVLADEASPKARQYESDLLGISSPVIVAPEEVTALLWRALYSHVLKHPAEDGDPRTSGLCAMLLHSFPGNFGLREDRSALKAKASSHSGSRSRSHLIQLAKRYIRDNLSSSLRLEDVSAYLCVSVRHLSRIFKEELGQSFVDYVTEQRMLAAESLLKTTLHSVKEIADFAGYQSVHYFTRVFSDRYGIPPAAYRSQKQKG
ncbi:helix-turn-helix transcriptional regulator [Cohnella fermenti]|uniref:AraC family transcriptional regulator n=1 Tax=Cohnella fermenti TaxID=2565925 RepID=A0A4V3WE30_9BACL|nr:AraC family transcriptional regulator [Cohnella fermenti]THF74614.1 AraC family transcriptional regulator [Cohnella fermenti]